jgi:hypothetical protein
MADNAGGGKEVDKKQLAREIIDFFQRTMVHHGLWYTEVKHQMGTSRALEILEAASATSLAIQMKHLGVLLGFEIEDGLPAPLLEMETEKLIEIKQRLAKNWLVNDGVWFQAVEQREGLNEAKRCNDSCWAHFSPYEAFTIKRQLGLPELPGLDGLKRALGYRLYESINTQSIVDESETSFLFQMNQCRVQVARKRKGLADYPCKSAGLVEYAYFARSIDSRITTECIGCPPDEHPEAWYCAWRFSITS